MRTVRWLGVVLGIALLGGCGDASWRTHDIRDLMPDLKFRLTDEAGATVTERRFAGNVVLIYFGFSHCRMACPVTLAKLRQVLHRLGPAGSAVRVLFVSVDPARDTPERLGRYTDAFGPRFVGLTGDEAALDSLTRRYRVAYGYGPVDAHGNYPVYHSNGVFVFDRGGLARLLVRESDSIADITADLSRLSGESR